MKKTEEARTSTLQSEGPVMAKAEIQKVNICGIPHIIEYKEDNFNSDLHLGDIHYGEAKIQINRGVSKSIQHEALCHEILHGILIHMGRDDLNNDEPFVTCLGNAISQSFTPKIETFLE